MLSVLLQAKLGRGRGKRSRTQREARGTRPGGLGVETPLLVQALPPREESQGGSSPSIPPGKACFPAPLSSATGAEDSKGGSS